MNDELSTSASPSTSTSAAARNLPNVRREHPQHAEPTERLTDTELAARRKKNRVSFNRKRADLLDDLLKSLDTLIYAELSTIYYMDCSFLRFLMRVFVQFVLLTPKPALFPEPPERPFLGGIGITNLICILAHLWYHAPSAVETDRGYLHGGLAIEFIGQKGPTSKLHLVLLDLLVLLLQVVHMSTYILRQKIKDNLVAGSPPTATPAAAPTQAESAGQSLDDEERGVRRSAEQERGQDIEMDRLTAAGATATTIQPAEEPESSEREALLATTEPVRRSETHILDAFGSGQLVIADLDLTKSIRDQVLEYQKGATSSSSDTNISARGRAMRQRFVRGVRSGFAARIGA